MKAIALNKQSLAVRHAASIDQFRPNLNSIHVTPKHVEACEGHWLVRITHPKVDLKDVPVQLLSETESSENFVIPIDVVNAMAKAIPKKCTMPILQNVFVNGNCKKGTWKTSDLSVNNGAEFNLFDGDYPDSEQVIPKDKAIAEVRLNVNLLADMCKSFLEYNDKSKDSFVTLKLHGPTNGVEFVAETPNSQDQDFYAIIMPVKPYEIGGK